MVIYWTGTYFFTGMYRAASRLSGLLKFDYQLAVSFNDFLLYIQFVYRVDSYKAILVPELPVLVAAYKFLQ